MGINWANHYFFLPLQPKQNIHIYYMSNNHKYIELEYRLYTEEDGKKTLIQSTQEGQPLQFYSNANMLIPGFEQRVAELLTGDAFAFTLNAEEAYGVHNDDLVISIGKETFSLNGSFDSEHIFEGAIVPLQNEQGERFMGHVVGIGESDVTVDLNHPLAGKALTFEGRILTSREADEEEVNAFFEKMNQHSCGSCGGCGGDCHDGGCCDGCK